MTPDPLFRLRALHNEALRSIAQTTACRLANALSHRLNQLVAAEMHELSAPDDQLDHGLESPEDARDADLEDEWEDDWEDDWDEEWDEGIYELDYPKD